MFPNNQTTIDIIRQIVVKQLQNVLPNYNFPLPGINWDQRVLIYNQEYVLPPIDSLWAEVAFVASKVYSSQNYTQTVNGVFQEVQNLYQQEHIMVRLFSKNLDALRYKELVMMGFDSIYSRQQQEKYAFKILNVTPFPDTSELEGGAINYRADLAIMCLVAYENIITASYLNNFETSVEVGNTKPLLTETFNPANLP